MGAAHVYAVDVGHGQLDPRLRADARVVVLEHCNVRTMTPGDLLAADPAYDPCPSSWPTCRSSRCARSCRCSAVRSPAPGADLVLLVKPQFEVGRAAVSRGKGVVRDPALWLGALEGVASALAAAGTGIMGAMASPLTGASGNVEFLLHARKGAAGAAHGEEVARSCSAPRCRRRGSIRSRPGRLAEPTSPWRPSPSWSTPTGPTRWRWRPTPPTG